MMTFKFLRTSSLSYFLFYKLKWIDGFSPSPNFSSLGRKTNHRAPDISLSASATSMTTKVSKVQQRRQVLLSRKGPFFQIDSKDHVVEFGATANLQTKLEDDPAMAHFIPDWLSNERLVATSIWDPELLKEKGDSIYELQVMKLSFVTLQLQPSVTVRMWTKPNDKGIPIFYIQSIDFEPNIQVLPGMTLNAQDLGITIEVAGQLMPCADDNDSCGGGSVQGKIAFSTRGILPGPLRLVPASVLQAAADAINNTIVQFATQSFQRGATSKYAEFKTSKLQRQQGETTKS